MKKKRGSRRKKVEKMKRISLPNLCETLGYIVWSEENISIFRPEMLFRGQKPVKRDKMAAGRKHWNSNRTIVLRCRWQKHAFETVQIIVFANYAAAGATMCSLIASNKRGWERLAGGETFLGIIIGISSVKRDK